jgi:hypothetical protein
METTFAQPDDFKPGTLSGDVLAFPLEPTPENFPRTVIETVQRQDVTEEFTQKLDVSGWPKVAYIKERFVQNDGSVIPPSSKVERVRRANGEIFFVLWTPVPAELEIDDVAALAVAVRDGLPVAGWNLSYHSWDGHWCECPQATYHNIPGVGLFHEACGRIREHRISGNEVPNLGMSDFEYDGFYPTIKGNDPAHWDPSKKGMDAWRGGPVLYGQPDAKGIRYPVTGREIRAGRAEYREATKNYYEYDAGYQRDVDKIRARNKAQRDADFELAKEVADKRLPRKLGEV